MDYNKEDTIHAEVEVNESLVEPVRGNRSALGTVRDDEIADEERHESMVEPIHGNTALF